MNELEYALETIDGGTFESLSMDFLRSKGYKVHESGSSGRDGGWDARIKIGDRTGIVHASTRSDWRYKLKDDAEKVRQLENDRDKDYDLFVFVTNKGVNGQQELDLEDDIRDEYGWTLQLYHRDNLLGEIRQNIPEVADRYLDIDLGTDHDHYQRVEQLRDDRIEVIRNRDGHAERLPNGSAVVLHVIPNGIFSQEKIDASELPNPPVLGVLFGAHATVRGKEVIGTGPNSSPDQEGAYSVLRNDGLYESVDWSRIRDSPHPNEDDAWIAGSVRSSDAGLDASVIITTKGVIDSMRDAGFSGSVFVSLSVLDAANAKLSSEKSRSRDILWTPEMLGKDVYSTDLHQVPIGDQEIITYLEPMLSEVWREFGYTEGTRNIDDGEWSGGEVRVNRDILLSAGDQ